MQQVPRPGVLEPENPDRAAHDHADADAEAHRMRDPEWFSRMSEPMRELHDYANSLWNELSAVREYLHALAGETGRPAPLHDGHDWEAWARAYAEVTSALAGPHGDQGYGVGEAREIAQRHGMSVLSRTAGGQGGER